MSERGQSDGKPGGQREDALRAAMLRLSRDRSRRDAAALRELTEPFAPRLSDRQRARIERLSGDVIGDIEDALRASILADPERPASDSFEASLAAAHVPIAGQILRKAELIPDAALVALALDRSDMHDIGRRLREGGSSGDRPPELIDQDDEPGASAAMALLIIESRVNLRFEDPHLPLTDLPGVLRETLVWHIAAALRHYAVARHAMSPAAVDRSISNAANWLCTEASEATGLFEAARTVAQACDFDPIRLRNALDQGRLALYAALIANSADIAAEDVWMMLTDRSGVGHATMLRATGVEREDGAALVMHLLAALGDTDLRQADDRWLAVWDSYTRKAALEALDHWRHPSSYREALATIGMAAEHVE